MEGRGSPHGLDGWRDGVRRLIKSDNESEGASTGACTGLDGDRHEGPA